MDIGEVTTVCDVVDAARFGWQLAAAKQSEWSMKEITRMLAEAAGPSIFLTLVFPTNANLPAKIDLAREVYAKQAEVFQHIREQIQATMIENPASAEARRAAAMASSQDYVRLTQEAVADAQRASNATVTYLRSSPNTSRVQGRCAHACGQLIRIYRTGRGWD